MKRTALYGTLLSALLAGQPAALAAPADDARAAFARGDLPAATTAWQAAIAAEPNEPRHYEGLGRVQLKARDVAGAVLTFEALVTAVPGYTKGRYRLAFALRKAGRLDEAASAYRAYVASAPDDPDGVFGLARTLEKSGDTAGAVDAYQRYIEMETRPSEAKWVADARKRVARLAPPAATAPKTPTATTAPDFPPASPVTPAPTPVATAPVTAPVATAPDAAATRPSAVKTPDKATNPSADASSPVDRARPAPDPDAAFARGDYAPAAAAYRVRLADAPDAVDVRYRLAVSALAAGDAALALSEASAVAILDPGNADAATLARAARALLASHTASPEPRIEALHRALSDGRVRTVERKTALAIRDAAPARVSEFAWLRARALLLLGQHDRAFAALRQVAASGATTAIWTELRHSAPGGDADPLHFMASGHLTSDTPSEPSR